MRFGKTISNKFDCFALNFRYFCKVLLRTMRDLLSVLRFLVSPASSWAVARRSTRPVAEQERGWFYPLLAVVAASAFVQMAYGASLTASLVRAVALFSALFGGSLLCPVLISLSLQRLKTDGDRPVAEWELKLFSMYNLSVLALVAIIQICCLSNCCHCISCRFIFYLSSRNALHFLAFRMRKSACFLFLARFS